MLLEIETTRKVVMRVFFKSEMKNEKGRELAFLTRSKYIYYHIEMVSA
jgi:hypothetical protein